MTCRVSTRCRMAFMSDTCGRPSMRSLKRAGRLRHGTAAMSRAARRNSPDELACDPHTDQPTTTEG